MYTTRRSPGLQDFSAGVIFPLKLAKNFCTIEEYNRIVYLFMISQTTENKTLKAVGLISGGLDSILAAKLMKDLGVDVYGVFFAMPWGCCDKEFALRAARNIDIKIITLQLDERYLEVVKKPRFGRGTAMNPCKDCRIHMFTRAAQYMRHIGADFVFTGEVLGQRPMSQKKDALQLIEREAGLTGKLLRPLCAQFLEPTDVEKEGRLPRAKLLKIAGRSRKLQYQLADVFGISGYSAPAGGCLLTNEYFAKRIKDTFRYGYRNFRETIALKWGRHYRFSETHKCIIGRDRPENESLLRYAHPDDIVIQLEDNRGPTALLKGENPPLDILARTAWLVQRFSKYQHEAPQRLIYWTHSAPNNRQTVWAEKLKDEILEQWKVA